VPLRIISLGKISLEGSKLSSRRCPQRYGGGRVYYWGLKEVEVKLKSSALCPAILAGGFAFGIARDSPVNCNIHFDFNISSFFAPQSSRTLLLHQASAKLYIQQTVHRDCYLEMHLSNRSRFLTLSLSGSKAPFILSH
jgi:hypothetical protein